MTTYFVSRHPGAIAWAEQRGITVHHIVDHLDVNCLESGDTVIGTLPVNLAAEVCARGGHYWHLSLNLPAEYRGRELSADDLRNCGARVEAFFVQALSTDGDQP